MRVMGPAGEENMSVSELVSARPQEESKGCEADGKEGSSMGGW